MYNVSPVPVMSVLVLPSYPAGYAGASTSVVGAAAAPQTRKVEPVGRAFQSTKHAAPKPRSLEADEADAAAAAAALSPTGTQLRDAKYDRYKKFDVSEMKHSRPFHRTVPRYMCRF
jgi:hypothetical protein